ncbi:MAG: PQQ-dependent sugar dehydrogenase [Spirochaetales bacterium]|nr:PQQ-dependent sugar dehydrogenase [Spirochaetales bacterium]
MIKKVYFVFILLTPFIIGSETKPNNIVLPPGFSISIFAKNIYGARQLTTGPGNSLYIGTRGDGVYAVFDDNKDFIADRTVKILEKLNAPNGVLYHDGFLFVAEIHRVTRYSVKNNGLPDVKSMKVINDSFSHDRRHGYKYIKLGPDNKLYIPVGVPCNVCQNSDERYGTIMRMNLDGSALEIYARGIRNSVGFDFHPDTGQLWFTDNGRDSMGDDIPPDELNHAPVKDMHFGFPFIHGALVRDPDFWKKAPAVDMIPPAQELGPHVAALGMTFYRGSQFPAKYAGSIFIAEHGSWNRSVPIGYRISLVTLSQNRAASYAVFVEGWLEGRSAWGRPVDILEYYDGSLIVSDDTGNALYRIRYSL